MWSFGYDACVLLPFPHAQFSSFIFLSHFFGHCVDFFTDPIHQTSNRYWGKREEGRARTGALIYKSFGDRHFVFLVAQVNPWLIRGSEMLWTNCRFGIIEEDSAMERIPRRVFTDSKLGKGSRSCFRFGVVCLSRSHGEITRVLEWPLHVAFFVESRGNFSLYDPFPEERGSVWDWEEKIAICLFSISEVLSPRS